MKHLNEVYLKYEKHSKSFFKEKVIETHSRDKY